MAAPKIDGPTSTLDEEFLAQMRLVGVPGVGAGVRLQLLERFGSAEAVFKASPNDLATVERVGLTLAKRIPTFAGRRWPMKPSTSAAGEM